MKNASVTNCTCSGLTFERQVPLPILYKGLHLDCGFKIDLIVEGEVILELKSVEHILPDPRSTAFDVSETDRQTCWPSHKFQRDLTDARNQKKNCCSSLCLCDSVVK